MVALTQQWVLPLVKNAWVPLNQMDLPMIAERILKLAVSRSIVSNCRI